MLTATPWGRGGVQSTAARKLPRVAVNVPSGSEPRRRRRRTPEVAEQEIIAAAEALLRERPFRELTVDEVMRRTDLSRPSFYVYFRDRHHLVLRVVEHIGGELFTMADRWFKGEGDGPELAREATEGIVAVFAEHGPVLRALADAAADDPGVEEVYSRARAELHRRHRRAHPAGDRGRPDPAARRARDRDGAGLDERALPHALARPRAGRRPRGRREHARDHLVARALRQG